MKKTKKKVRGFFRKVFITNAHHKFWIVSSVVLFAICVMTAFYSYQPDFQHSVNTILWGTQQTNAPQSTRFQLPVTVVYDTASADQKTKMDEFLANLVNPQQALTNTDLQTKWLDYHSPEAQTLIAESGLKYLPQIYIDPVIEKHPQFNAMSKYLNKKDNIYFIRLASLENLAVPPTTGGHVQGLNPSLAKVVIQAYQMYSSSQSQTLDAAFQQALKDFPNKISIIYRHFEPGDVNNLIAQGAECANDQNKFFEMGKSIYQGQNAMVQKLESLINQNDPSSSQKIITYLNGLLDGYAKNLHLNLKNFQSCMINNSYGKAIEAETLDALDYGVSTAPTLFINQQMKTNVFSYSDLKPIIQAELSK